MSISRFLPFTLRYLIGLILLSTQYSVSVAQPPMESFRKWERYQGPLEKKVVPGGPEYTIHISSKDGLSQLNGLVRKAIKAGKKNIVVDVAPGEYLYDQLTVYLYNIDAPDVCVSIQGHDSRLIANGNDYTSGRFVARPDMSNVYLDQSGKGIDLYEDVFQTSSKVEIVNEGSKLCRIKTVTPISFTKGMKIQLTEWYQTAVYDVTKTDGQYVYFVANDLKYDATRKCYNVNYDYGVSSLYPRYRIWNPSLIESYANRVHECSVSSFLCLYRIKLKCFSISGFHFNGAARGKKNGLFYFREVDSEKVMIENCSFENINHRVVEIKETNNFIFRQNNLKNCVYDGVYASEDCSNTIVTGNAFYRMGKGWTNCAAVACYGRDYVISDNTFEDIGYCSVASGAHVGWTKNKVTRGIIERNHIWFSDEYYNNCYKYTLVDGGAIHVGTMNERIIIRYNYIHNYRGINSDRAIYCDEGAMNVKIYGNVIRDIPGGNAIFSWRAKRVNSLVPDSNDGIDVFYNVIWGKYSFDEKENSSCIHGKNLVIYDEESGLPKNQLKNFAYSEKDIFVSGATVTKDLIVLPRKAKRELKKFPTYNGMKQWFL